jgi:hypothetical protein
MLSRGITPIRPTWRRRLVIGSAALLPPAA